jgi:hypothetical protein
MSEIDRNTKRIGVVLRDPQGDLRGEVSAALEAGQPVLMKAGAIEEVVKVAAPPIEIMAFDGRGQVLVAHCCDGKVICREVFDRDAHRYAHGVPVLKGYSFHCAKCDRELTFAPKPKTSATASCGGLPSNT